MVARVRDVIFSYLDHNLKSLESENTAGEHVPEAGTEKIPDGWEYLGKLSNTPETVRPSACLCEIGNSVAKYIGC
ncbi:Ankyrin-3 [Manis pentadactyla]|nr:Ankyrin-3 [Manis pentadactyla]